jgi:hypothetical protein
MRLFRVFFAATLIFAIAGCAGMNAPTQPNSVPELLYVGTSNPGLLTYKIGPDGGLQATATSAAAPPLCYPTLEPVPGRIFVVSASCSNPNAPMEFRRLDLDSAGNIASATAPLSLGLDFPSSMNAVTNFVPADTGKFAYTWSIGSDAHEHISVIQIDAAGELTLKPSLGLSWPIMESQSCGEAHQPVSVVTTQQASFLVVLDRSWCRGSEPILNYFVFQVDSETGAIGNQVGEVAIGESSTSPFAICNGALIVVGELNDGVHGDLRLFHLGTDGVTLLQPCLGDHPACAHPNAAAFHPSGKWIFVTDQIAGGIWTIPVTANSLAADKASFFSANVVFAGNFNFSGDGKSVYLTQFQLPDEKSQIIGFRVDDSTGGLTPIPGSPWSPQNIDRITDMTLVVGTNR